MNRYLVITLLAATAFVSSGRAQNQIDMLAQTALLHEAQGKWGLAAVNWRNLMERLEPRRQEPKAKERYYEAHFGYIKCLFTYGAVNVKPIYIERAARLILKVEEAEPASMGAPGLKEAYEKLLKDNPLLKWEHDKAKKEAPAALGPSSNRGRPLGG